MLHVVNGDASLDLLKQSTVTGTFLPWKDMLMEGPIPSDGGAIDLRARASFLAAQYGADPKAYRAAMRSLFAALDKATRDKGGKEEVVLWFEEDFFCQIHLVYLLAHLPAPLRRKGRTSIVCPDKPLGTRVPAAFPKLLAGRLPVTKPLLELSARVWKAYAADTPAGWEAFLRWSRSGDAFQAWPKLRSGLRAHLGRLPTVNGSPHALETSLLRALAAGPSDFGHYAKRVWADPLIKPLGLGDLQIARYALDLASLPIPLIEIRGTLPRLGQAPAGGDWQLRLTEAGQARLAGPAAAVRPDAPKAGTARAKPSKAAETGGTGSAKRGGTGRPAPSDGTRKKGQSRKAADALVASRRRR